jgi:hypothetical protein
MELVASITRVKDFDTTIKWLRKVPKKYSLKELRHLMSICKAGDLLLFTEEDGIRKVK